MKPLIDHARLMWARFQARTVNPMAPAALLLDIAIPLADLERRA